MYRVTVRSEFSAAHNLRSYRGTGEPVHGHNWKVAVRFAGPELNEEGLLIDFVWASARLDTVLDPFRHAHVNEVPPFDEREPSAENLARFIYESLAADLPDGVDLTEVEIWETAACSAAYRPEPGASG